MGRRVIVAGAIAATMLAPGCVRGQAEDAPAKLQPRVTRSGTFDSGGARLSFRLDLPQRFAPVPAVVFGHGSGRQTKDACRRLADGFVARGYATLCFDKRGVGESTGEYSSVGTLNSERMFALLSDDMAAAVRLVREQADVDASRVGLVGTSQAGWIVPLAATKVRPAFMILFAGPAVSVGEEIFYSDIVERTDVPLAEADIKLETYTGPRGFDPRPVLESLATPGLWLLGDNDRSIPIPATVAILDGLASKGKPFTRIVFPGAGHDLGGAPIWDAIDSWTARVRQR